MTHDKYDTDVLKNSKVYRCEFEEYCQKCAGEKYNC